MTIRTIDFSFRNNKTLGILFSPKSGCFRVGPFVAVTGKGYVLLAIAGICNLGLSSVTGKNLTIRIPGGTRTTSKWVKFGQNRKGEKFGRSVMTLPKR